MIYLKFKHTEELAKVLDEIGVKIVKDAIGYAVHAGRKTVKDDRSLFVP